MDKSLEKVLVRAAGWSKEAQAEPVRAAERIEAKHRIKRRGAREATRVSSEELAAIDEGLEQLRRGELVPEEEMEAFFDRDRP